MRACIVRVELESLHRLLEAMEVIQHLQICETRPEYCLHIMLIRTDRFTINLERIGILAPAHRFLCAAKQFLFGVVTFFLRCGADERNKGGGPVKREDYQKECAESNQTAQHSSAVTTVAVHFKISPVFEYHRSKSSSSKSMPTEPAKSFSFSSIARYLAFVEGGFGVSITPNSASRESRCLSSIAYPRNPTLRKK